MEMGISSLIPLSPSQNFGGTRPILSPTICACSNRTAVGVKAPKFGVWAKLGEKGGDEKEDAEGKTKRKQSLFSSVTEALDFSQARSAKDAQLIEEAREATRSGNRMSKEQYGALRRKIGGTYKDFFKSYVEVEGQYVEDGWVDKTCKVCGKDTMGSPRQVDKLGRYVHVACLDSSKSTNFFSRLFSSR